LPDVRASRLLEIYQRFDLIAGDEDKAMERRHDNDAAKRSFATTLRLVAQQEFRRGGDKRNAVAFFGDCVETMRSLAGSWQQPSPADDELIGRCQMGRGSGLRRLGLDQATDGRALYSDAAAAYEAALAALDQAERQKRDEQSLIEDARYGLAVSLILSGRPKEEAEAAWIKYQALAQDMLRSVRASYEANKNDSTKRDLVSALGSASAMALFNRDPSGAARYAEEANELMPPQAWIEVNRAHAYLLLGRFDAAQVIYRRCITEDPFYAEDVKEDFRVFRQRGVDVPSMGTIEREFGIQ
jgi:tetratricopeptide (TPR) repeat protein